MPVNPDGVVDGLFDAELYTIGLKHRLSVIEKARWYSSLTDTPEKINVLHEADDVQREFVKLCDGEHQPTKSQSFRGVD